MADLPRAFSDDRTPLLAGQSTAVEETSQQTYSIQSPSDSQWDAAAHIKPKSQFVPGVGRPFPAVHNTEQEPLEEVGRRAPTPPPEPPQPVPLGYKTALVFLGLSGIAVLLGMIVSLVVLLFHPNPDIAAPQIAFMDDLVPLSLSADGNLPHSYDTTWYDWLIMTLTDQYFPLTVLFVKGDHTCDPPVNNTRTIELSPPSIPVVPDSFPVEVVTKVYLPSGANLRTNFTLTTGPTVKNETTHNDKVILFCILDSLDSYNDFTNDEGDLNDCIDREAYTYPIINGSTNTMNYTVQKSAYYFILLLSTSEVTIQYSYNLQYQFYDIRNYSNAMLCNITEESNWKDCMLQLDGSSGCFFARSGNPERSFTRFKEELHHKRFSGTSIIILASGVGFLLIVAIAAAVVFAYLYRRRRRLNRENG